MRLSHSSILIFTCFACLSFYPHRASTAAYNLESPEIAQASSTTAVTQNVLTLGSEASYVQIMQIQLKDLGYYNGVTDGVYGQNTQNAVIKFQKSQNLARIDGTADRATRLSLQTVWAGKNPFAPVVPTAAAAASTPTVPETEQPEQSESGFIWWTLLGLGILGSLGAFLFALKRFGQIKDQPESRPTQLKALSPGGDNLVKQPLQELEKVSEPQENHVSAISPQTATMSITTAVSADETTSALTKLNIVDELIHDLRGSNRPKRRRAIWDLGQQGDSRAIQPLVDLMIDADSQQRSLILAALAEINSRALTPMNRALAISLQDESPQVRQNAIRDLTRVYDMMIQMSQMLAHALEDPDINVQTTAKYALSQMNKMRTLPDQHSLPQDNYQEPG
ncbi:peptidoglycan-binding protein [Nodularia sp. NIES-3585]|uniref:peptidoglycan-binding protein n=1 Tax=Nodularia sp. NIES-3585 TaxID=1973477 RepID=UPI000B5C52CE|nr:peptidoglycan-binding protein [Nodularia sp. NIES-3585]GAX38726.1 peptidoglycan-binding domain 1 [Nodularia sp. NIES-3585]